MAGRICGSKLIEEVIATETNLEDISLRIFKSMGTDEITRVHGSKEREEGLATTPRTPAIWWDHKLQEVRSFVCISGATVCPVPPSTWLGTDTHQSLAAVGSGEERYKA